MSLKDYLIKNGMGSLVKELDHTIGSKVDITDVASEVKEGDSNPVSGGAVFDALKNIEPGPGPGDAVPITEEELDELFD